MVRRPDNLPWLVGGVKSRLFLEEVDATIERSVGTFTGEAAGLVRADGGGGGGLLSQMHR